MNYLVSLSGGIDSTTVLAYMLSHWEITHDKGRMGVILFKYPSKHNKLERKAAMDVAAHYDIKLGTTCDVSWAFQNSQSNLLRSGGDIPEGHYASSNMNKTVVPMRNILFATMGAIEGHTLFNGEKFTLCMGMHAGDHTIYADCRPETIFNLSAALRLGSNSKVGLLAPFINDDKTAIVKKGLLYGAPYHLTRTCYTDGSLACGKCGSCVERLEAFKNNGVYDPIPYTAHV